MNTEIQKLPTYIQEKIDTTIVPIKYTAAVKALAECRNIEEAKYFADKSEALAAWAKIYQNDQAAVEAKRLKLHAFRRMGALAMELQPAGRYTKKTAEHPGGALPGPDKLLEGMGLSRGQAQAATAVSRMPKREFNKAVNSPKPKNPAAYRMKLIGHSDGWRTISTNVNSMSSALRLCRRNDPKKLARSLTESEVKIAREMAIEIAEWMDTFEQYLGAEK